MKLIDYDRTVGESLRQKILEDMGNPTFKEKVLDLITKYENDAITMKESKYDVEQQLYQRQSAIRSSQTTSKTTSNNGNTVNHGPSEELNIEDEDSENLEDFKEQVLDECKQ